MESHRCLRLDSIARKARQAVLVFPMGKVEVKAFIHLMHARGLPEQVLLVRPHVEYVPHLPVAQRAALTSLSESVRLVDLRYGFDDEPDVPKALRQTRCIEPSDAIHYYVVDDRGAAFAGKGMARWRKWLFMMMSAACVPAAEYFHLPADRTTELHIAESEACDAGVYGTKR
ncbi:MAG TPA: hypothetical protein VFP68_20175 [Burkholderiaceae bacterium]|nr:hypothetical protein [Burkholderiaceae bacterium]